MREGPGRAWVMATPRLGARIRAGHRRRLSGWRLVLVQDTWGAGEVRRNGARSNSLALGASDNQDSHQPVVRSKAEYRIKDSVTKFASVLARKPMKSVIKELLS